MISAFRFSKCNRQLSLSLISGKRSLLTLAIESSCDDSAVAVLEKHDFKKDCKHGSPTKPVLSILFHDKVTANNLQYKGVHPIVALDSHQENLGFLVDKAIKTLPRSNNDRYSSVLSLSRGVVNDGSPVRKPDFVTVTRGPGMRSNLSAGLDLAKGLSVAWQVPMVAVNHMQAHALTPRLVAASKHGADCDLEPRFPFLSLLVSGGHTMLVHSKSLNDHPTLASTVDIAIGDAIDKIALQILPSDVIASSKSTMYGPVLETWTFPNGESDYNYSAPMTREMELSRHKTNWDWSFGAPLAETRSGSKSKAMEYSFSGTCSTAKRIMTSLAHEPSIEERREMAREAMRVCFEHLASRIILGLKNMKIEDPSQAAKIKTLVLSGGVAANQYLRHTLRAFLDARGFSDIELIFPPLDLCTDNAIMIGWTGFEMFEAGWTSDLSSRAIRRWSLDPGSEDGGILGAPGWIYNPTQTASITK